MLDGRTFRFSSFNAPELMEGNDDFEAEDTMRTLAELGAGVTRTYTLNVAGTSPKLPANRGHIIGWNAKKRNWNYDEAMFRKERGVIGSDHTGKCHLMRSAPSSTLC